MGGGLDYYELASGETETPEDVMEYFNKNLNLEYGWYRGPSNYDFGIGFCNNRINDPPAPQMTLEECASACLDCNEKGACGPTEGALRPQGLTFDECASFERNGGGRCFIFPPDASTKDGCDWEGHGGGLDYYELASGETKAHRRKVQEDGVAPSPFDIDVAVIKATDGPAALQTAGGASPSLGFIGTIGLVGAVLLAGDRIFF